MVVTKARAVKTTKAANRLANALGGDAWAVRTNSERGGTARRIRCRENLTFDPIEAELWARSRQFIEELIRSELDAALARPRYGRSRLAGCRPCASNVVST